MTGAFFNCHEVVNVVKKYEKKKGKKKMRKRDKGNEEEGKKIPSDSISTTAGMMIRSVHLGIQCD